MAANNTDGEAAPLATADRSRGGWATAPFIIATMFWLTLAAGGWLNNLIVFMINEFNIKSISAAKINSVVSGCANFFPLIGAILADSLLGCYSLIWISSLISLLGLILLVLTVTVDGLRPPPCEPSSKFCNPPSPFQYTVLYSALGLVCIGVGGTRFTLATMGANQFTKITHQATYFNWYFCSLYTASFVAITGIVYVEDSLSWGWGFGICIAANALGLALFLIGSRFYNCDKPQASPFTSLLRVVVASVRKRKAVISSESADYYHGVKGVIAEGPTKRFRVLPLWSSSIFLGTPIGVQLSLTVLQALTTNRHLRHRFQFPAGSIIVFSFISTVIGVTLIDHCLWPLWKKLSGNTPTYLQQLGIGHVLNVASMAVSALVESKRRSAAASHHQITVAWLVPQMVLVGLGEAFHLPGQVGLYYQEFPSSMKSLATAMVAMLIGVAFYLSSGVIDFMRRVTDWLPDDIDDGRVDYVYWVMVIAEWID
ncbi:hypothetical protein ACS0TY_014698 [Phlomoides rotata]